MGIKLEKEFEKLSEKDAKGSDPVSEVKLLLEGDRQDDLKIMRHLASGSQLIRAEEELGQKLITEKLDNTYGKVYTHDQVKALAIKYRLRFLQSFRFTGNMDIQCIAKLKEFAKDSGLSIMDEHTLSRNFYVLAPQDQFNYSYDSTVKWERAEARRRAAEDPVLFYKIDHNHYRMIHQWGGDLSLTRIPMAWYWRSEKNYNKAQIVGMLLICVMYHWLVWTHITDTFDKVMLTILGIVATVIVGIARITRVRTGDLGSNVYPGLFTENNWNSADRISMH